MRIKFSILLKIKEKLWLVSKIDGQIFVQLDANRYLCAKQKQ